MQRISEMAKKTLTIKQASVREPDEKKKNLEEYEQEKPFQLNFFTLLDYPSEDRKYSNTLTFYDFIPRFFWGKSKRENGKYLPILKRDFHYQKQDYRLSIIPARVESADGTEKDYYPGQREELVEDALKKLAVEGHCVFLDGKAAIIFNIHQIQEQLKRGKELDPEGKQKGHTLSYEEIKEALTVLSRTTLQVKSIDGTAVLNSHIIEELGIKTREEWKGKVSKDERCYVIFNNLITSMIKDYKFRRFNYEKLISLKRVIARQLFKRMSHHYKQASKKFPYTILLSTMDRDFGLEKRRQQRDRIREAREALQEMIEKKIINNYKEDLIMNSYNPRKIEDVSFELTPSDEFIDDTIHANEKAQRIEMVKAVQEKDKG